MKNFGLADLRLVDPRDAWPNPKAEAMAAGAADVVMAARLYPDTKAALAELNYVLATTARERGITKEVLTPSEAARRLAAAAARGEKTGILFGNERAGLDNDEISFADAVITIPTAEFASLNLGQAVLLSCYEWFRAGDATPMARIEHAPLHRKPTREEMFGLFEHLEREFTDSGFLFPPDKREHMVAPPRHAASRAAHLSGSSDAQGDDRGARQGQAPGEEIRLSRFRSFRRRLHKRTGHHPYDPILEAV